MGTRNVDRAKSFSDSESLFLAQKYRDFYDILGNPASTSAATRLRLAKYDELTALHNAGGPCWIPSGEGWTPFSLVAPDAVAAILSHQCSAVPDSSFPRAAASSTSRSSGLRTLPRRGTHQSRSSLVPLERPPHTNALWGRDRD